MSIFQGTKDDFKKYIGGYCRNKVRNVAKTEKDRYKNKCACCGEIAVLEAAHLRGFERTKLIEDILDENFKTTKGYVVNLDKFEKLFKESHLPISEHFFFLCRPCHHKYDKGLIDKKDMKYLLTNDKKHITDLYKSKQETVQQYVKRLLRILFGNKLLSEEMVERLQDKGYCRTTFGLGYPLLEKDESKIRPSGIPRYYTKWKLDDEFFVCKEWWKEKFPLYEEKLKLWVDKIMLGNKLKS